MTDIVTKADAPTVSLRVEGDLVWDGVGAALARADAGQQVEFLLGFAGGLALLDPTSVLMQFAYIADAFPYPGAARSVADHLENLSLALREVSGS